MSSLKIRPTHDRIFNSQHLLSQQPQDDLVEETVFLVDEETGEIVEGRQMVPRDPSVAVAVPAPKPQKDNKFIGLAMRKKSKVSFM